MFDREGQFGVDTKHGSTDCNPRHGDPNLTGSKRRVLPDQLGYQNAPATRSLVPTNGHQEGVFAESEAHYARAIALNPHWIILRCNYSMLAHWQGQFDEAARRARGAIAIDESFFLAQSQLATVLSFHGGNRGSNPRGDAKKQKRPPCVGVFVF
jgi:tetratricopeptide (TPR) repeat protein